MPYRVPAEIDEETGELLADDVIDPEDPASLTLDLALTNPKGYAARWALLSEAKQAAWLGRVSVGSLRAHFSAVTAAELRIALRIRDGEIAAEGFAHPRSPVTFVKAASLATQTARIARALGLPFVLDVDAALEEIWRDGAGAVRRVIPDLEAHSIRVHVTAPYGERSEVRRGSVSVELEWSSAGLGGSRQLASLAHEETTPDALDREVALTARRAKAIAADLAVSVVVL